MQPIPEGWTEAFGERVRAARNRKGLTQVRLAAELGWTRSNVCMIESGHGSPRACKLVPLARVLGITLEELLGEKP